MKIIRAKSTLFKVIVTIISLIFIYWYGTTQINWYELLHTNVPIHWEYFILGFIFSISSTFIDGYAWFRVLKFIDQRIKPVDAVISHFLGSALGLLIPAAGTLELASETMILQKRYPGLTSEEIISSIASIRTIFLVTAYVSWGFLIVSLGYAGILTPLWTLVVLILVWIILTLLILIMIIIFGNVHNLSKLINFIGKPVHKHPHWKKYYPRVVQWLENFARTFQYTMKMPRKDKIFMLVAVFSQNFIKWLAVYFTFYAVFNLPFWAVMVSSVLGGFVNLVPAGIPALAGLREIVIAFSVNIFIHNQNLSLIGSFLQTLGLWLFFLISGLIAIPYLLTLKKSPKPRNVPSTFLSLEKQSIPLESITNTDTPLKKPTE